jgi:hypothetical protein
MRRWFAVRVRRRSTVEVSRLPLSRTLAECAGNWVALDRKTNELLAAAPTADELTRAVREQGLRNVAVLRAPDPSEPELVGLG